jgi:VanZ family protein
MCTDVGLIAICKQCTCLVELDAAFLRFLTDDVKFHTFTPLRCELWSSSHFFFSIFLYIRPLSPPHALTMLWLSSLVSVLRRWSTIVTSWNAFHFMVACRYQKERELECSKYGTNKQLHGKKNYKVIKCEHFVLGFELSVLCFVFSFLLRCEFCPLIWFFQYLVLLSLVLFEETYLTCCITYKFQNLIDSLAWLAHSPASQSHTHRHRANHRWTYIN